MLAEERKSQNNTESKVEENKIDNSQNNNLKLNQTDNANNKVKANNSTKNTSAALTDKQLAQIVGVKGFESKSKKVVRTIDPRKNQTQVPLSQNGYARFFIVACGTGLLFGLGGLFYFASINSGSSPIKATKLENETIAVKEKEPDNEIADLKTRLALQSQRNQIEQMADIKPKKEPVIQPEVVETVKPTPPPAPTPQVVQREYVAPPPPPPKPEVDGLTQWQKLSRVGSFRYPSSVPTQVARREPPQRNQQNYNPNRRILNGDEQRIIERISSRSLLAGTKIEGVLQTAIFWNGQSRDTFTVDVTKDVKQNSRTLIKKGDRLIIKVESIANSGLVRAVPIKLIRGTKEVNLPAGLIIRKRNLDPMIARSESPNSPVISNAFKTFALGALSNVGAVINQPNVSSTVTPNGNITVSSQTNRSVVGGVLEGGLDPLLQQQMQQSQQRYQQLVQTEKIWFVPGNKSISIYANTNVDIPLI